MLKRTIQAVVVLSLLIWGFFWVAGRWDWMRGWTYLAVLTGGAATNDLMLWRKNPELLLRRGKFGEGTKTWDKFILFGFGLTSVLIMLVGALDAGRYQWSSMPAYYWPVGAVLYGGGQSLLTWSMLVNPFFEKTARIQTDRGHRVIDCGPYRYVRHPGYTGTIIGLVMGSPLLLGSWWAFIPASVSVIGLVIRTILEDKMLREELDGYEHYARRVPYKLIPHVW